MRFHLLGALALASGAYGTACHDRDDDIGNYCELNPYGDGGVNAFLDAARLYCAQYLNAFTVPKGDSSSNIYQMKIADVPDGFGGHQIFWGNYKVVNGADTHLITFDECYADMQSILTLCPKGQGGWIDTDFGTVFGECIRQ